MPAPRAVEVVRALLEVFRFSGVAAVAEVLEVPEASRRRVRVLAEAGERLLDLDAEDFDLLAAEGVLPDQVVRQIRAAQFPRRADAVERGSLRSLVPLYELMLEALDVRWRRREPVHVVTLLHLIAEYLPVLAWEPTLGHAADPLELTAFVDVPGGLWGSRERGCDHTSAQRSAAQRIGTVRGGDVPGWTGYLDRFHSRVSDALARCGSHPGGGRPVVPGVCRTPCPVWTQLEPAVRADLGARVHLARMYAASPAVDLRHYAPVGHFFGVPAPTEIAAAWERSWARLARPWESGDNPLRDHRGGQQERSEALPGMSALVSAIAGRTVVPGGQAGVLAIIRDEIAAELEETAP